MNESQRESSSDLRPGTVRWRVLAQLAELQSQWTAPQLAVALRVELPTVIRALGWLREHELVELRYWVGTDSLHMLTDAGHERLRAGAQLALEVAP